MKPFLILQLRADESAAKGELEAIMKFGGLKKKEVHFIRMEKAGIPALDLKNYSGVIIGGGPSNVSDPKNKKSKEQLRFEKDLFILLKEIYKKDFPFLGICYGINIITAYKKGKISKKKYTENVGAIDLTLTKNAKNDPLTKDLPKKFRTFVGHKEACQSLPKNAVLLASSKKCPIQMIRLKKNIYATQFHPELDVKGIKLRINVYKNAGYFPPKDAKPLIKKVEKEKITIPMKIMKNFIDLYRQ